MTKAVAFVSYGMGGASLDPAGGEARLVARLKALGIDTAASLYHWSDTDLIAEAIGALPADTLVTAGGDSLGANEAPAIAELVAPRRIALLFGFQPSDYGQHLVNSKGQTYVAVPENVDRAVCIWDPTWWDTLGLGACPWAAVAGNRTTTLLDYQIRAAHPGDTGQAQDIVFDEIKRLVA